MKVCDIETMMYTTHFMIGSWVGILVGWDGMGSQTVIVEYVFASFSLLSDKNIMITATATRKW